MKRLLTVLRNIVIVLGLSLVLLGIVVFGIRKYNDIKYKPYDISAQGASSPTDLSQYDTEIEGVEVSRIVGEYINGFRLRPLNKSYRGVVVTFGGSEGSPGYFAAEAFAKAGYETLALFYYGMENQQKELVHVPLEFFGEALSYIDENIEDGKIISVYGASKGAELALNLAVLYPEIDNVILLAPTAWNYMGLSQDYKAGMRSSWTLDGQELPFIDVTKGEPKAGINLMLDYALNSPIDYRPAYESAANNDPNAETARIKVEDTEANILIFAGAKDKMWQSEVSAQVIEKHRPKNTEIHIFDDAGHIFFLDAYIYMSGMILEMGGDLEANTKAGLESNAILVERMAEWHK